METKQMISESVQLLKGEFSPSQAKTILMALLDQKINYHKVELIQLWEKDHNFDPKAIQKRIDELEEEKVKVKDYIEEVQAQGSDIIIDGSLQLNTVD